MFDALRGTVTTADDGVLVDTGALVFAVACAARETDALLAADSPQMVYCVLEGLPDTLALYGFASTQTRAIYRAARAVKGVGPTTALAVAGAADPMDVLRAVAATDTRFFEQLPGVGKSRAEALCRQIAAALGDGLPQALPIAVSDWIAAREALCADGHTEADAEQALWQAAETGLRRPHDLVTAVRKT